MNINREVLERNFSSDQIRQREGSFGQMLDYVPSHLVVQRLNDAFETNWAFEVHEHQVVDVNSTRFTRHSEAG